ncbi:MAG: hypothetical protein DYG89_09120 [Caldilinea sp. CFX5]|nr:hypothetical protein [Caldilinea sp. CFX5]
MVGFNDSGTGVGHPALKTTGMPQIAQMKTLEESLESAASLLFSSAVVHDGAWASSRKGGLDLIVTVDL